MTILVSLCRRAGRALCVAGLLIAAPGWLPAAVAQTLHAIVVADTDDPSIGVSVKKDFDKNVALMRAAAAGSGLTLSLKEISGAQLTIAAVRSAVAAVAARPDDTVVFLYSGHGYRLWRKEDKYPFLYISQQGLDFNQMVGELRAKKPRLLIALTDSCNEYADKRPEARAMMAKRAPPVKNYRRLWREARGEIVIASSSQGEYAWGDDAKGGYFTDRFHASHEREIEQPDPKWETILTAAKAPITVASGATTYRQTPLVDFTLAYAVASAPPATQPTTPQLSPAPAPSPSPVAAALNWVPGANGAVPQGALPAGSEPGRTLFVCRARYGQGNNVGVHPGKVVGRNCNIGWGGREILLPSYEVLVANPARIGWVAATNGQVPPNAVVGGQEPGRNLAICRARYGQAANVGVHPGKVVGRNCNIGWGGREILLSSYEVLVTR